MRVGRILATAVAGLAGATAILLAAGAPAAAQDACGQIRQACEAAGFRHGQASSGRGLDVDCFDPIVHHQRPPTRPAFALPHIDHKVAEACANGGTLGTQPHGGELSGAPPPPPAHAVPAPRPHLTAAPPPPAPEAPPTPTPIPDTNAADNATATNAATAGVGANAAAAAPVSATNDASNTATNAATNAVAAAPPAGGLSPLVIAGIVAALLVVAAGVAAAVVMSRRRKPPAPSVVAPVVAPIPAQPIAPPAATAVPPEAAIVPPPIIPPVAPAAAAEPPVVKTHDVFISYSSKDKPTADAICAVMERHGVRCWIAPRDILPGQEWAGSILRAIVGARVVVLVFSASTNASPQVLREIERAVHNGASIIPFRVEDVPYSDSLEYFISTPHWLDALTPPLEEHAERLAASVKSLLSETKA